MCLRLPLFAKLRAAYVEFSEVGFWRLVLYTFLSVYEGRQCNGPLALRRPALLYRLLGALNDLYRDRQV